MIAKVHAVVLNLSLDQDRETQATGRQIKGRQAEIGCIAH
jgi:hypothetical protein